MSDAPPMTVKVPPPAESPAETIARLFRARVEEANAPESPKTRTSNWASSLSDPCVRRLFYWRTCGASAQPLGAERVARMEEGHGAEESFDALCRALRFKVQEDRPEKRGRWDDLNISGRTDRWIRPLDDPAVPLRLVEFKSTGSPWIWEAAQTVEKMRANRWTRGWLSQVAVYMWMEGQEEALLIVKRPGARQFVVHVLKIGDLLDLADRAVEAAKGVEEALRAGEAPPFLEGDAQECRACPFFGGQGGPCYPPLDFSADAEVAAFLAADDELAAALRRRAETEEAAKANEKAEKFVKERMRPLLVTLVKKGQVKGEIPLPGFVASWRAQRKSWKEWPAGVVPVEKSDPTGTIVIEIEAD